MLCMKCMQWSQNVGCGMIPDDISVPGVLHSYRSSQGASVGIIISISMNMNLFSISWSIISINLFCTSTISIISRTSISINIFSISMIIIKTGVGRRLWMKTLESLRSSTKTLPQPHPQPCYTAPSYSVRQWNVPTTLAVFHWNTPHCSILHCAALYFTTFTILYSPALCCTTQCTVHWCVGAM